MLNQFLLYGTCFLLGWLPLYWGYRKIELAFPFKLQDKQAVFSYFPFLFLFYLLLEFIRSYLIMVIVVDFLAYDFDLVFGIIIWFIAVSWPPFIPKSHRTAPWVLLFGIYFYLFPTFILIYPLILILLFLLGVPLVWRYFLLTSLFSLLGIYEGANSLFVLLYVVLVFFIAFRNLYDLRLPQNS